MSKMTSNNDRISEQMMFGSNTYILLNSLLVE